MKEDKEDGVFAECSFTDVGLNPLVSDELKDRMGFKVPTLIQKEAIPLIISGGDILVNAKTGTGKTMVYLAPIIHHLQSYFPRVNRSDGTFGITILVATPGRLLDHLKHTSSFVYNRLRWLVFDEADRLLDLGFGKDIVEILSLLQSGQPGFSNDNLQPSSDEYQRQNLLLSATLNDQVNNLAKISLNHPVTIGLEKSRSSQGKIKSSGLEDSRSSQGKIISSGLEESISLQGKIKSSSNFMTDMERKVMVQFEASNAGTEYKFPSQLFQSYIKVPCRLRLVVLLALLRSQFAAEPSRKVVVFFSTCDAVDFHYALISEFHLGSHFGEDMDKDEESFINCKTFRLHGSMAQEDRKQTFHHYNEEKSALLLCTDVAARGLDFPKVRSIIQYDSPGDASEHVHRVGRTARLGQKGEALLFLQPIELDYLQELQKHGVPLNEISVKKILDHIQVSGRKGHKQAKWTALEMHPGALSMQMALESFIMMEGSMKQLAKDAFCSFVRAYAAHRGDLKRIFQVKKLHLGHVAKSFGLKDQPSLVGGSFNKQKKKRERSQMHNKWSKKKRRVV